MDKPHLAELGWTTETLRTAQSYGHVLVSDEAEEALERWENRRAPLVDDQAHMYWPHTQPPCSWCPQPAILRGEDGTYSCGQGQGDGLVPHDNLLVFYHPLRSP